MKSNGYTHSRGDVKLTLAKSYGFCWGVERAVQMAYEARKQYPTEKMWITNEIIHNPSVNQARLRARRAGGRGAAARPPPVAPSHPLRSGWLRWA